MEMKGFALKKWDGHNCYAEIENKTQQFSVWRMIDEGDGVGAVGGKWISRSHLVVAIQIAKICYNYHFDSILSQNMDQHSFLRKITALTLEIAFLHPNIWCDDHIFFVFDKFTQIHLTKKKKNGMELHVLIAKRRFNACTVFFFCGFMCA